MLHFLFMTTKIEILFALYSFQNTSLFG